MFVNQKPRDSRVVEKRLTGEKKSSVCGRIKTTCQSKIKTTYGGFINEKRKHRHKKFSTHKMALRVPYSVCAEISSGFMGYLKGKSALLIFQRWGNMKFAYRNREFWCKGYYVDTVGKNTKAIKNYIAEQLKRDQESDQLAMFDPRDPFMGSK